MAANRSKIESVNDEVLQRAQLFLNNKDPKAARSILRESLERDNSFIEAKFLLGLLCCQSNDWLEASTLLGPVVQSQPDRNEALYWLGLAPKGSGNFLEAIKSLKTLVIRAPTNVASLNELGLCYLEASDPTMALSAFDRALKLNPKAAPLWHNRGLALARLDRVYEARDAFLNAIQLAPTHVESYVKLSLQLEKLADWTFNLKLLISGLRHLPQSVPLLVLLAGAYSQIQDLEAAERTFQTAMRLDPGSSQSYGLWLQEQGRFEESVEILSASLRSVPIQGSAFYGLTEAKHFRFENEPLIIPALKALENPSLDASERVYLLFAVGKMLEKNQQFEAAFDFFNQANQSAFQLFNAGRPYDRDVLTQITDRKIARFSQSSFSRMNPIDKSDFRPILIVGMIRSGTTLLDQILSTLPGVGSAGEQNYWMTQADLLRQQGNPDLTQNMRKQLESGYQNLLQSVVGDETSIIDKMPLNYGFLGLILQVFPQTKILHLRRNPLDTCLSIYTTYFGQGPNFAYNKSNLAFNYFEYLRLMDHWRKVLPEDAFFQLDYENLVVDREVELRKVVQFCNLEWDDACLNHQQNSSSIKTPSRWQARQKVYNTSIDRWRNYQPWLGELAELKQAHHPHV